MAALSAARNTPMMGPFRRLSFPVKGSTTVYEGGLCVLNAGYLAPGSTATGLIVVGVACKTVANAGADGAVSAEVWGCYAKYLNASGDPVVAADVGATIYITDDQTVNHTSTGKSAAGKCYQIDSDGVWVAITQL